MSHVVHCGACPAGWLDCDGDYDEWGIVGSGCETRDRDGFNHCPVP